jgi:hypothetical protein
MLAGDYPILKRGAAQICICGIGVLPRLLNYDDWRHQSGTFYFAQRATSNVAATEESFTLTQTGQERTIAVRGTKRGYSAQLNCGRFMRDAELTA